MSFLCGNIEAQNIFFKSLEQMSFAIIYRTCPIKGRSRLVAAPLRFQAKIDFLCRFYVLILRLKR